MSPAGSKGINHNIKEHTPGPRRSRRLGASMARRQEEGGRGVGEEREKGREEGG